MRCKIVSIKFDEASRQNESVREMNEAKKKVVEKAKKELPDFFHPGRMDDLQRLFEALDVSHLPTTTKKSSKTNQNKEA